MLLISKSNISFAKRMNGILFIVKPIYAENQVGELAVLRISISIHFVKNRFDCFSRYLSRHSLPADLAWLPQHLLLSEKSRIQRAGTKQKRNFYVFRWIQKRFACFHNFKENPYSRWKVSKFFLWPSHNKLFFLFKFHAEWVISQFP